MKAGIVQRIFRDHFETYRGEHAVGERERRAAWNIMTCRTAEQGFHVDACPKGHYQVILNNSCKHRSCPQCGMTETEIWLERRRLQSLACRYFHIVFTLSHDLHGDLAKEPETVYGFDVSCSVAHAEGTVRGWALAGGAAWSNRGVSELG